MALENKLGIKSSAELAREEERISKKKAVELFENGMLEKLEAGKFQTLCEIHKYLFDDIYDFAGKIRTVNLSKGNFRFAPLMYLETAIKNVDKMPQNTFDEIVEKYVEMNIVHPFREGNGRSMRIWLDMMLKKQIGQVVDWSKIEKEDYLMAMERSPIKDIEIKYILNAALTDQINDRENDIVYNRLDLIRCIVPGTFNGTRHIAGAGGKGRGTEQANCQQENQKHAEEFFVLGHKKPPFFWKERP